MRERSHGNRNKERVRNEHIGRIGRGKNAVAILVKINGSALVDSEGYGWRGWRGRRGWRGGLEEA